MDGVERKRILEGVLFAADRPVELPRLRAVLADSSPDEIRTTLGELRQEYDAQGRAFEVVEIAGGWQILTRPEMAPWIARLDQSTAENRLSAAALQTLAIIAYKQPIHRGDLEAIRGVQCGPLLRALMDRGLVRIAGRAETLGRPVLYATTDRFLELLGLRSLKDLPKPEDLK